MEKETPTAEPVGWDHPLVIGSGYAPSHLLSDAFGYTEASWRKWVGERPELRTSEFCRRQWFHLESFYQWMHAQSGPGKSSEPEIGWDHPMVKLGFAPGHLLREMFGYTERGWAEWCSSHQHLVVTINRQPWFNLARFIAWTESPEAAA